MLHVHFCVSFQHGPCVPAFIFSVKDGKPSAVKFLSGHFRHSDSRLHLLPHRREKEVSSPNPFPYITLITMINLPLFNLKAAQLALVPQLPPNASPPRGLVELSLLRRNVRPRSYHSFLDPQLLPFQDILGHTRATAIWHLMSAVLCLLNKKYLHSIHLVFTLYAT